MSLRKAKQLLEQKKQKNNVQPEIEEDQQQQQQPKQKKTNYFSAFVADDSDQPQQKPQQKPKQEEIKQQPIKKKKNKKKKKKEPVQEEDDAQKIEQVLREFKRQNNIEEKRQNVQDAPWCQILNVNQKKFNYEKQMRKHFRGWQQEVRQQGDPQLNKKQQNLQKHLRKLMKKSVLSPGVKEYFPIQQKFEVQVQNNFIRFAPTKKYQHYQVQYQALKNSNDINALFHFTQTHPEHVDSLYSVGQFLRLQGNYRQADSLIQRVIYIYEMCGGYQLNEFIKKDMNPKQLRYDQYSTSFFMALFKFLTILGKKGCFNTALQYNKYLLKLNYTDPTACLLCIDYNAISAKQLEFLISFVKDYVPYYLNYIKQEKQSIQSVPQVKKQQKIQKQQSKKQEKKVSEQIEFKQQNTLQKNLYCLPNFAYSIALTKFMLSNLQKSEKDKNLVVEENNMDNLLIFTSQNWQQALNIKKLGNFVEYSPQTLIIRAIMLYPKLILDIAEKNQYNKLFLNHPSFQNHQKKTMKQILNHQFWKLAPQSYSYHFLRMESLNDSQGLDKILEIYIERSKILWRGNDLVLWLKGALGFVLNQLEKTEFNYQLFLENLCTEGNVDFQIPFLLRKYQNVFKGNFSDRVDRIDLNNIQDNQGMVEQPVRNNINVQSGNALTLFLQSLLPWVNVPQQQGQADPDMPFIEDDDDN